MSPWLLLLALGSAPGALEVELTRAEQSPPASGPIQVGAPFVLTLIARHAPGGIALLPEALALPENLAERREARRHERKSEGASELDTYQLELLAFTAGTLEIPAIPVAFGSTQAATRPLTIEVVSGLSEDEQKVANSTRAEALAELERMAAQNPAPRPIQVPDPRPLYAAAALAGTLLLVALLRRFLRRKGLTDEAVLPTPPPRPAHEVALERLHALKQSPRDDVKAFYVELSEILRAYLGGRYQFDSLDRTVAELLAALDLRETLGLDRNRLRRVLEEADLVKFAKYAPEGNARYEALEAALALVEATRPAPEPGAEP